MPQTQGAASLCPALLSCCPFKTRRVERSTISRPARSRSVNSPGGVDPDRAAPERQKLSNAPPHHRRLHELRSPPPIKPLSPRPLTPSPPAWGRGLGRGGSSSIFTRGNEGNKELSLRYLRLLRKHPYQRGCTPFDFISLSVTILLVPP